MGPKMDSLQSDGRGGLHYVSSCKVGDVRLGVRCLCASALRGTVRARSSLLVLRLNPNTEWPFTKHPRALTPASTVQ